MPMQVMRINSKDKAEGIVQKNKGKRRMHWVRNYYLDKDGALCSEYLIFYAPIEK